MWNLPRASCRKNLKKARGQDKDAAANVGLLEKLIPHLDEGKPANLLPMDDDDKARLKSFFLLSAKSMLYACNLKEEEIADPSSNEHLAKFQEWAASQQDADCCVISAKMEEELSELPDEEAKEYLEAMGVADSGVSSLDKIDLQFARLGKFPHRRGKRSTGMDIHPGYDSTSSVPGVIHTDFEKNFIKAEVVSYPDLIEAGSMQAARESGKMEARRKGIFVYGWRCRPLQMQCLISVCSGCLVSNLLHILKHYVRI